MRLGLLGPANGALVELADAARRMLDDWQAERVVYLAADDALDRVVTEWAARVVGADPSEPALLDRAADRCARARPEEIDAFLEAELALERLRGLVSLPMPPGRTVEILDGRVAVLVYDKAYLDEEDIAAASLLIYGRSAQPLVKRVGSRTFVTPGALSVERAGRAILDDGGGGVTLSLLDRDGTVVHRENVVPARLGKVRVQGGRSPS